MSICLRYLELGELSDFTQMFVLFCITYDNAQPHKDAVPHCRAGANKNEPKKTSMLDVVEGFVV